MTDARLPDRWLGEVRFLDLSDAAWRVFTAGLMWSAGQGTDGTIPSRYVKTLRVDGVDQSVIEELVRCGVWISTEEGISMPGWADRNGLGQSLAADVAAQKERNRLNQAAHRERVKSKSASGDISADMGDYVGNRTKERRKKSLLPTSADRSPLTSPARTIVTVRPGEHCPPGQHRLLADGTCMRCEIRPGEAA